MPQLRLLREPQPSILQVGVSMPPAGGAGRWGLAVLMQDHDGRGMGDGYWRVPPDVEHADLGHLMRDVYDAWFNGAPEGVLPAAERALKRLRS